MARTEINSATTYYVNPSTGDNSNAGTSAGSPWLTLQYAIDWVANNLILNGVKVTIQLADGSYVSGPYNIKAYLASYSNDNINITIQGNASDVNAVTLTGSGITIGGVDVLTPWVFKDLTIQSPTGGIGILADRYTKILLSGKIKFTGSSVTHHIHGQYSSFVEVLAGSDLTIASTGTGVDFSNSVYGSCFLIQSAQGATPASTITFSGTVSFANGAFVIASDLSVSDVQHVSTWTGSFTGPKFYRKNGIIKHNNNIPGSSAGVSDGWV